MLGPRNSHTGHRPANRSSHFCRRISKSILHNRPIIRVCFCSFFFVVFFCCENKQMIKIPLKGISNKDIDEQIPKSATFTALPLFWAFERLVILTEPIKCSFSYFDHFLTIFTMISDNDQFCKISV